VPRALSLGRCPDALCEQTFEAVVDVIQNSRSSAILRMAVHMTSGWCDLRCGGKAILPWTRLCIVHRWQTWRCGAFGASPGVTIAAGHSPGHFSAALRLLSTHEHLLRNDMGAACKGEPTRRAGKLCTQLWHQADARAVLYLNSCGTTSIFVYFRARPGLGRGPS